MLTLYVIKNCDTCRKAVKALPQAVFSDVRADGVPEAVLEAALQVFADKLVNTRSTTWRGLDEAERARDPLALLQEHPTLMKRPLIAVDDQLYLGWTKEVQGALL